MSRKDEAYLIGCILAVALIIVETLRPSSPEGPAPVDTPAPLPVSAWIYSEPPEGEPILGLWERPEAPGFYDAYSVVRIGAQWIADVPDGHLAVSIEHDPPECWTRLP